MHFMMLNTKAAAILLLSTLTTAAPLTVIHSRYDTCPPPPFALPPDETAALNAVNAARTKIGHPCLHWDSSLASDSAAWARHDVDAGRIEHATAIPGRGECIYMEGHWPAVAYDDALLKGTRAWISEGDAENFEGDGVTPKAGRNVGHYQIVVGAGYTKMGVGKAVDGGGSIVYVVGRFQE